MSADMEVPGCSPEMVSDATRIVSEARAQCAALGVPPEAFAALLLPEALLAMMVAGMRQEEVEDEFARFARENIPAWFLQVKRTAGYCDCEREARGEHAAYCDVRRAPGLPRPLFDRIRQQLGAEK